MWIKVILALLSIAGVAFAMPPQSRVVNGTDTDVRKFPFIASIRSTSGSHSCGCSIIAPNWILTAAHCLQGRAVSTVTVQFASTVVGAQGGNVAAAKRYIIHENYAPLRNYANDIALIELSGRLVYNYKTIAPVNLPEQNYEVPQTAEGAPGVLAGWGLNATGGVAQKTLQEVDLKIYSDAECTARHNGSTGPDQICGGVDEGGKGQCSGDSGGPLLHKVPEGLIQVGIVSWSVKPCTIQPYPGVYTKVSHYINWIKQNMI